MITLTIKNYKEYLHHRGLYNTLITLEKESNVSFKDEAPEIKYLRNIIIEGNLTRVSKIH